MECELSRPLSLDNPDPELSLCPSCRKRIVRPDPIANSQLCGRKQQNQETPCFLHRKG
jgi:hypothetical protein